MALLRSALSKRTEVADADDSCDLSEEPCELEYIFAGKKFLAKAFQKELEVNLKVESTIPQ